MPLLFSYGTLQLESVQLATFGRLLAGKPNAILGFQETMMEMKDPEVIAISGKTHHPIAAFSGNPRHRVDGMAFEVSDDELRRADGYETNPAYRRFEAQLMSGGKAWVYADARFEPSRDFDPHASGSRAASETLVLHALGTATLATVALVLVGFLLGLSRLVAAMFIIAYTVVMSFPLSWGWPVGRFENGFVVPNGLGLGLLIVLVWLVTFVLSLVFHERRRNAR
jgi:hypothetical protein